MEKSDHISRPLHVFSKHNCHFCLEENFFSHPSLLSVPWSCNNGLLKELSGYSFSSKSKGHFHAAVGSVTRTSDLPNTKATIFFLGLHERQNSAWFNKAFSTVRQHLASSLPFKQQLTFGNEEYISFPEPDFCNDDKDPVKHWCI